MSPTEAPGRVMVVDDDPVHCELMRRWLEGDGHEVIVYTNGESCLRGLTTTTPEAICLDLGLPGMSGADTLLHILEHHPRLPVIVLTANTAVEQAVALIQSGAFNYLTKPVDRANLLTTVSNAIRHGRLMLKLSQLEKELAGWESMGMLGESEQMKSLFRQIDRVAPTSVTVLIQGESGTGKELVARAIHAGSARGKGPLLTVNCATIPENLQESELFGHEKGAFTGASGSRAGIFELANGGTVFLDEVGELSLSAQAKLLRVVQEGTFQRVGGERQLRSDFRLLAATNRDLSEEVGAGRFREDLYFRLAVFELEVPPLRDRGDDAVLLAGYFARAQGERLIGRPLKLASETVGLIRRYPWPGNVRELENAVQRAVVASTGSELTPADFPSRIRRGTPMGGGRAAETSARPSTIEREVTPDRTAQAPAGPAGRATTPGTLEEMEKVAIMDALTRTHGNVAEVSRLLGIGRTTLYAKMKKYGLR